MILVGNVEGAAGRDQHVFFFQQLERELLVVELRQHIGAHFDECVQRADCVALKQDQVKSLPVKGKAIIKKERWFYYYLIVLNKQVYVKKRTGKDIWQNLHEFVLEEASGATNIRFEQSKFLKKLFEKQAFTVIAASKVYRQLLSHQHINGQFVIISVNKPIAGLKEYMLIENKKIKRLAFPGLINKYLHSKPEFLAL